ncbi:tRNA (adenosine(37)-N6)-threonylcarbamoyltransferase complex dimerization subunit type 1 TsaB [Streptomyces bohaiensis]|uniref:tRNA (Adenosine(37)-N6)-threonylcarbamoyltransferase complex dimerization subunit type 1 TsaB n=1 Tax=Streptomyces bohaiensis TaxID=1431344 RepID=A0ABX1CEV7_9ACTN|nr:tRNA (adenosine(37)-N6)-threonylcarbamoyltransferase complex dimerization subunit type 1 TsaB [Streptomyces bohaiensis]NJQ17595.1 tRNA (adenosine(37)-N6)-threonylcarbamoyltransferase complex dimerization subunit type 1 TsaB [Streptomyces bohaiensis]
MLLLALDTATPAVTAALHDGTRVLAAGDTVDARRHGELLLPTVDRVFAEAGRTLADLTGVVVGVGPGPYTGLRVGLATGTALAAARSVPVHGLCSLDSLAYASGLTEPFVVATDARRREVYWARYEDARHRTGEPEVGRPGELPADILALPAVGAGAVQYGEDFPRLLTDAPLHASAAALASLAAERLAAGEELAAPSPLYLRRPDAQVPAGYKVVTPPAPPARDS